jgi:regulator of protease activity HflC (stomatin/prohibitin superfamily)
MDTPNPILKMVVPAIIAFAGISVLTSSWYTVDEGERAVILRNGAVDDRDLEMQAGFGGADRRAVAQDHRAFAFIDGVPR